MFHVLKYNNRRTRLIQVAILLLSLFFAKDIMAQTNMDSLKALQKKYRSQGREYESKEELYHAIDSYDKYFAAQGDKDKIMYRLANLFYSTRDYQLAYNYYDSLTLKDEKKFRKAWYYKGLVCMNLGKYEEAVKSFENFRRKMRGKRDPDQLRRQAESLLRNAQWASARADSFADITVQNLGRSVNHRNIEFSPFPVDKSHLIYGALMPDTNSVLGNHRQLYAAELTKDGWKTTGKFPGPINVPQVHTGNAALSPDGQRIYFTRCAANWRDKMICSIYVSDLKNGNWQDPKKLPYPINDDNYTSTQPAVGQYVRTGADILYFVSDRPGTRGGLDIWYSIYDKRTGEFKAPRNAGSRINTRGNECCPFYDNSSGVLYFSSTERGGYGGYDIQKSIGYAYKWTDAVTLPKPVNSSYDDTYFSVISGTEDGFFTSNRPGSYAMENGSCCDDIFSYHYNQCTRIGLIGKVINRTNYDVIDELNRRYKLGLAYPVDSVPAPNIPVQLFLEQPDSEEIMIAQTTTDPKGEYHFFTDLNKNYKLVIKNYGFFDKVVNVSSKGAKCSDVVDAGITQLNVLPKITVRFNVYYEHDKSRLTPSARATLDTLILPVFDLFPSAVIEIGSHTDNTGTESYNDKLSQRRSESVVKYLISKGISPHRLVAKGYGERFPIAPNQNPDGSDNPEGRQLNRRTELKIVGETPTFFKDE